MASFVALFVELALIRFIPAHVRVVGYYTNIVLISCFFGLGIGFLLARLRFRLERFAIPLLLLTIVVVRLFSNVVVLNLENTSEPLWLFSYDRSKSAGELPLAVVVLAHYLVAALAMVPIGQLMGRLFGRFARLKAYSLDLGGSLAGIILFGILSALRTPPILWFSLAAVLLLAVTLAGRRERLAGLLCVGLTLWLVWTMGGEGEIWSPYYKVALRRDAPNQQVVMTNDTLHQVMLDFDADDDFITTFKERFRIPYEAAARLDDVLIVGAGTGNDVTMALRMGAESVDAVEIDPVFPELGRQFHKQAPYDSDRVTLHVTDARAYFKRCEKRYDLVVFGTLDSQALLGGLSSIRLDNYVYTMEAFTEAYSLLKPDGVLAVLHMSWEGYIGDRVYLMLTQVAARPPVRLYFREPILFNNMFLQGKSLPIHRPSKEYVEHLKEVEVSTDNWPFLYLREPGVPWHYGQVLIGILLIALLGAGGAIGRRLKQFDVPLFLLGAGFLLLETKSVTQMSLLFGSTWVVNLLVFSAILAVLLAANLAVLHLERKGRSLNVKVLLVLLAAMLIAVAFVPVSWLSGLPSVACWLAAGLLVALPIGIAGLVFPSLFRLARDPVAAFGANLLGAIVGGSLEYCTMLLGISSLTLVAAVLYLLALVAYLRKSS